MRLFSGGAAPTAPSRPSTMIAVLAAATSVYLAIAVYYAVIDALAAGQVELWLVCAGGLIALAIAAQINWGFGLVLVLAVSFIAQLVWVGQIGAAMVGDLGVFWLEARKFAASVDQGDGAAALARLHASNHPSALAVYGTSAFLFNRDLSTVQALTAAVWTVQTWLVWKIASEVSELKSRAFACALIFGLSPTLIVFGGLPSVEALFGLFVLAALYIMLSHRRRGLGVSAAYSGALVALAFLARPAGVGYVIGLVAVLAVGFAWAGNWVQRRRMAGAIATFLLGFSAGVSPQLALNYAMEGRFGIAPGRAIGDELLSGTDWRGDGDPLSRALAEIEARAAEIDAPVPGAGRIRAEDLVAREIALARIADEPLTFLHFAVTEKMSRLWSSERQMLRWSLESPEADLSPVLSSGFGQAAPWIVGGGYLALLIAAAAGALRLVLRRGAVRDPTRWVLFYMAFVSLSATAALGDAQERRHLAFTPLLALLAPLPFARLPQVADTSIRGKLAEAAASETESAETPAAVPAPSAPAPAPAAAPDPAPGAPAEPVETWSAEQKLAHRLRSMSKPPRPPEDEGDDDGRATKGA